MMLKGNKYLKLIIFVEIIIALKKIVEAQQISCGLKCTNCSVDGICQSCDQDFTFSQSLNHCISKCNDASYYYEPNKTCQTICPTNYYNDNNYNLCVPFQECANVQEYGQQYFDSITTTVQTPTSYIAAGTQNSNKPPDYSLKIFSRDSIQLLGEMTLHKYQVLGFQMITNSSTVSYNSDSIYLVSFSNTELVLWDLSRGIGMKYLTFDQLVTSQQSNKLVYYIDEEILIVFKSEIQFGVFFLKSIKQYNDNDVISVQLVQVIHTKSINGFVRNGNILYSYSMDSTLASYDLNEIYVKGNNQGNILCTIPNQILQQGYIFSTGEIVIQLYQQQYLYYYDQTQCNQVQIGHTSPIIQIIIDEKGPQKYVFSLETYKIIFSTADQQNIVPTSNRQISKSFAFKSQGYLILIDFSGFVVLNQYTNGSLQENYSINLNWSKNFQITSAFVDLQYSQVILIGQGVIKLKFDPTNPFSTQMQLSSITQNVPTQQDQPTDKINGLLIDTLYNRLIVYSDDGSIRAYERMNVFDNNYRQVIKKYHTSCNILDNSICQNKVIDLQLINQKLYAALYSDGSIILWQYLFTDFQSLKMLTLDNPLQPAQTMNYNLNTNLLVFQSPIQVKVYNTTTSSIVGILNVNSTLVNFQYAFTEIYTGSKYCIYVLDTKNKRLNLYLANNTKTVVAVSSSYSSKKLYTSAKYFPTHRNVYIITDTNICYYNNILTKNSISQVGISGVVTDSILQNTVTSVKHLIFMNNLQVFSYSSLSTLAAQYTSATNVQDYQATYNKVNNNDVFAFFQNSGVSTIQNQVVVLSGTNLNFQHILTFQQKISTILIDSVFSKLYIGFQNGQIYSGFIQQTYEIWLSSSVTPIVPVGFYYNRAQNLFIYYKNEIRVVNSVNFNQLALLKVHNQNLVGFFYSQKTNTYLSCSSEPNANMFRLNFTNVASPQSVQFQTSGSMTLSQCFLDDQNGIAISYYSSNYALTFWSYTKVAQIYTTPIHQQRAAQLLASQADIDPTLQISYQIQQIYLDSNLQKLIVVNNVQEVYMHNYVNRVDYFISIPNMLNVYIDQQYQRLTIIIQQEYKQTFYSYTYNSDTIEFFKEFQYHNNPIRGIIFQNDKAYSYEDTFIIVMGRNTYDKLVSIQCVNPIITNFIVFEKLSLVIIWSDFNLGQFNQSIGIYNLLTGSKITDVVGYQSIETGNIHQIIVDQDSYQMIIAKNNPNNYFYTVDLRTFYYTGYYANRNYTTSISSMLLIPESNRFIYLDQKEIRVMSIETSINPQYKFLSLTDSKNLEQFYNSQYQKLYFLDGLGISWQLNTNLKQLVYQIPFQGVRQTAFINQKFYVIAQNQIMQYNQNFVNLGEIDQTSVNVTFSQNFVFIFNSNYQLYIADQDSFASQYFYQFDSFFQQIIINENFQEIFVLQQSNKLNRFNFVTRDLLFNFTDPSLDFIRIDTNNSVIFQAYINGTLNIYPNYTSSIYDYMTGQPVQKLQFNQRIFRILIDSSFNKFYVLLNLQIPLVYVYFYNVTNGVLQNLNLITLISLPSRSTQLKAQIYQQSIIFNLPWQMIYIDRQTLQYTRIDRDNQIFYNQQNVIQVVNYSNLYIVQSNNQLAMYQLNNSYTKLFQFNLMYPKLSQYSITNNTNSYYIQLLGISSGIVFSYNFVLPMIGQDSKPLFSINQCYQTMDNIQYGYQVEQQMIILDQSSKILQYNLQQTLIQIYSQNSFYYHQLMQSYNSNVVYGYNNSSQTITIRNDTFTKLLQSQIIINNYNFTLFDDQEIVFPSINQQITFKNINITSDSNNFQFIFNGQNTITLQNIKINNVTLSGNGTLFTFNDCYLVEIDTFNLLNSKFKGINYTLFSFNNVQQIVIKSLNLVNIIFTKESQANNIIYISNSLNLTLFQSLFLNISSFDSNKLFIKSNGILLQQINGITVQNIVGVSFYNFDNYFSLEDQTVYLYSDQAFIQNSQFINMTKVTNSLITFNGNILQINKCNFTQISCLTCSGASLNIKKAQTFILQSSYFLLNQASEGGAVALINLFYQNLQIIGNTFYNCTALSHGGAIYSSSSDIMVNQTTIQFCQAQIGGGIRYTGIQPIFIFYQYLYQQTQDPKYFLENNITNNQADVYGQNIGSYPQMISVMSNSQLVHSRILTTNVDNYNIDQYSLSNFQSSANINFQFQILDQELNPVKFNIQKFQKNQYPEIIQNEITDFNIKAIPGTDDVKIYGQYITDYSQFDEVNQTFQIQQMMVIANPGTSNYIFFETPSIKMVLQPSQLSRQFDDGPFHVRLNMSFRDCIRGEVYKLSGSIFYCQECKEGSYSIITPIQKQYETQICQRCPDDAVYCYRDQMTLYPGYWKINNDTDSIVYCKNKAENCYGTQETGYCIEGHIGPLCESCDVYGVVWKTTYQSDGKFNCLKCQNLNSVNYIIPTIFIALGIIIYILISIRIILQINKLIVLGYYIRKLNLLPLSKSSFQDTTNMNLKAMMSYMQISSMINTFVIQLPEWMTFIPDYLGSPVQNLQYSFDCILNQQQQSSYPIVFFRTIWFLAIPVIYLAVVGFFYLILVLLRISKFDKSYIISGLVFLSFFIQPNMISNLLGVMSCRSIDNKLYIQSDISYECYTDIHKKYIAIVCLPGLILWAFIIPLIILKNLIQNRDNLDNATIRLKYGFLYQDYKNKHFYWEFVRIYTKMAVVAVLSFYGDPYTNKLVIILCMFLIYQVALIKFQPYQMKYFQQLDKTSMIVFVILLIMNIFLYNKPDIIQSQIFYIVLLIIHNGYQFFLLVEVVRAKLSIKYKDVYNKIVKNLLKMLPFMKRFLTLQKKIPFKTFRLWMKVKFFLNECSERRIYNEQNSPQFGRSSELNPESVYFQPSKRNRNRMFNQNLLLASSRNIAMSNRNIVRSEEISKNNQHLPQLSRDMNLLSIDSNNLQLLSAKGISSTSQLQDIRAQSIPIDSMHQQSYSPYSDVSLKRLSYGQLLRSLFNYADVEEEEDFRRIQKKAAINQEYRLYQKIDLIYKNLKQVEMEETLMPIEQQPKEDNQTPNIDDSINDFNNLKAKRFAQSFAPRFITSVENLDANVKDNQELKQDSQGEVIELSEQSQVNVEIQQTQNKRYVYLQNEENIFDQQAQQNKEVKNENIEESVFQNSIESEEEEDIRRLIKKSQFQHDLNLKRKTNLIYKNLFKVNYNENEILQEQNKNQKNYTANDNMLYNIEDSLLSLNDSSTVEKQHEDFFEKQQSQKQLKKQIEEDKNMLNHEKKEQMVIDQGNVFEVVDSDNLTFQKNLESNESQKSKKIVNIEQKNIEKDEICQSEQIEIDKNQSQSIQNSSLPKNDISCSKQIQNIIDKFAQNLQIKEGLDQSIVNQSANTNLNQQIQSNNETPQSEKITTDQLNKKYIPSPQIMEEDENIIFDEAESENTAKDNMTQANFQKVNDYFQIPVNLNDNATRTIDDALDKFFDNKSNFEIKSQRKKYSEQFKLENESIIQDHVDDQTLFKELDYGKQFTPGGLNGFEVLKLSVSETPTAGEVKDNSLKEESNNMQNLNQNKQVESQNESGNI
ncbi:transmembrane protein, putative (macronuclear) [Tetrahymena thermophila SB210]|uniref:Transmembrane protein, putative n=1 Tax=Tetrahymena thermophila (strain SB210) TaxID=312017 RepID=I7LZX5_TETTS|nr:transmembrane protein, putative [Tetrahymena thermophila SB210]EAR85092.2 transmembrane protein, putative [Tetrahymena thermophila SB210]|eukprot:XP_001032755.2 transmembrane protein, putative [Tetrahymena thermophila SB210]